MSQESVGNRVNPSCTPDTPSKLRLSPVISSVYEKRRP